jgi:hypothetical protein
MESDSIRAFTFFSLIFLRVRVTLKGVAALPEDRQGHLGVDRPLDLADDVGELLALDRLAVDFADLVAREDVRREGRGVLDGGLDKKVAGGGVAADDDAHAAELAFEGGLAELLELLGGEVFAVGVELRGHALEGAVEDRRGGDAGIVAAVDLVQGGADLGQLGRALVAAPDLPSHEEAREPEQEGERGHQEGQERGGSAVDHRNSS